MFMQEAIYFLVPSPCLGLAWNSMQPFLACKVDVQCHPVCNLQVDACISQVEASIHQESNFDISWVGAS